MKRIILFLGTVLMLSSSAFAEGKSTKSGKMPEMAVEQRNKMAEVYEKMAACLRSDRPFNDCHDEMIKSCQDSMGSNCPTMLPQTKLKSFTVEH